MYTEEMGTVLSSPSSYANKHTKTYTLIHIHICAHTHTRLRTEKGFILINLCYCRSGIVTHARTHTLCVCVANLSRFHPLICLFIILSSFAVQIRPIVLFGTNLLHHILGFSPRCNVQPPLSNIYLFICSFQFHETATFYSRPMPKVYGLVKHNFNLL